MEQSAEQRQHQRYPSDSQLKIYTSIVNTPYTVHLADVSQGGVFIRSQHFPLLGETVTYHLLNGYGQVLGTGHGEVVRLQSEGLDTDGFGVAVDQDFTSETLDQLRG